MKKGVSTGPTFCAYCKRKKETSIREQVGLGLTCGSSQCTFHEEIKTALQVYKRIKISTQAKSSHKIKILPPLKQRCHESKG